MDFFVFLLSAYLMGCIAAVPAGPVQIEVVRRSINGHIMPSLAVVSGAFLIDVVYGGIAFFGLTPFLTEKKIVAEFWLIGGAIMTILGVLIIVNTLKQKELAYAEGHLKKKRWGFIGGLSLSATNPVMILWWLSGARIFRDVGLIKDLSPDVALSFIVAGSLGLASYLTALSFFIFWAKRFISFQRIRQINLAFGVLLLSLAAYFIVSSVRSLLNS